MNMQNLMMQAQKIKKEMEKTQNEILNTTYNGNSQLVDIVMKGDYTITSVKLKVDNNFSFEDKEMLEDMILLAVNEAKNKIEDDKKEKFGKYNQVFNGLM